MPFFYSQHLKDEKSKGGRINSHPAPKSANKNQRRPPPASNASRHRAATKPGVLVWHSGTGASGKTGKAQINFKPLGYKSNGKRNKVVHFSTIEVQPFHFDWSLANDVFYTRAELTVMGQSRFDDAATLRQQRRDSKGNTKSMDDVGISKKSNVQDMVDLLASALDDSDRGELVSIRGIEHFVYPALQQEMIRRKKELQKEVMGFVRSKRPDPQGWRLAEHSRQYSAWARNVALEKGMKYCKNNAATDPEVGISEEELDRFEKSQEELDNSSRSLRGSSSYGEKGSASFDAETPLKINVLHEISEGKELNHFRESQTAGTGTGEG